MHHTLITIARAIAPREVWTFRVVKDPTHPQWHSAIMNRLTGVYVTFGTHDRPARARAWAKEQIAGLTWMDATETPDDWQLAQDQIRLDRAPRV